MSEIKKEFKMKNFIGVFDNYIPDMLIPNLINLYESQKELNKVYPRLAEGSGPARKKDNSLDMMYYGKEEEKLVLFKDVKAVMVNFDMALKEYIRQTDIVPHYMDNLNYTIMKIQKTLPTEGYHLWHCEWGGDTGNFEVYCRGLVYTIYLNDVEEGGETEFLHFSQRVKPKKGRIVIWPAGFPYVHRGNPPISGEKYILTSWLVVQPTV
jgi:hypothetical protein|tara:strand:+ start:327 stop:953 length:627 start_codon:yes stop_codon:yes gene_type:complete